MLTFEEQAARFRHYNESMVKSHILDLYRSDREVQVRAANQLCDYSYSPLVVRHLIEQLNSERPDVRLYAKLVLTRLGPSSFTLLISALQNEDRSLIRCGIIKVLGNIGSLYATTFVVSALNDTDLRVRQAVAYALMIIEDEETTPILCQSLRSSDNYIRCCAAITLGNINTEIVKSALDEARQDSDKQVREYIEEALLNHKKIDEERLESFKIWCVGERNRRRIEQDHLRQKEQDSRQKAEHDLFQKTNDRPTVPDKPAPQTSQDKAVHADSVVKQPATYQLDINAATQQAALHEDTIHEEELPKAETDEYLELAYRDWDELWDYRVGIMLENLLERRGNILLAIEMVGGHPRAKRSLLDLLEGDDDILREAGADALLSSGVAEAAVERRLQRYEQRNNPSDAGSYKFKPSPEKSPSAVPTQKTPARSGYAIPTPPPPPTPKVFALDMDSVRQKIVETAQVQELLQAQFVEDEGTPAVVAVTPAPVDTSEEAAETNPFKNLDTQHFALLNWLMKKPSWKRADVEAVAQPLGVLVNGALERLNDMALDMDEDNIFEGDDPIEVNIALIRELLL